MTVAGFILLLVAAIVGLTVGAHFAESFAPAGIERTFAVAIITAAVLFPAARLAGWLGWIRGGLNTGADDAENGPDSGARS
jgi:hypothetical protein